jgi:hypothetical protein
VCVFITEVPITKLYEWGEKFRVSRGPVEKEDAKIRRACGWMCSLWRGEKKCAGVSIAHFARGGCYSNNGHG